MIGENEDDDEIASDDEEIDSDAAFEETDEERFAGFFSQRMDISVSEDGLDFDPSDDEEAPEALDQLNDFISTLDVTSKKRKTAEDLDASTDTRARKRRLAKKKTEAGFENEFRARSSGILLGHYYQQHFVLTFRLTLGSKLNIDDLLAPLASQSLALQSLKASAKVLTSSSSKAKTTTTTKDSGTIRSSSSL